MWSSVAAVLAFVGVAAAFMVSEDEEPLALSPRGAALTAISAAALVAAATLAVAGLASWGWTGTAAGWSVAFGTGRRVYGWLRQADDFAIDRERGDATVDVPAAEARPEPLADVWLRLPRL
jgi:hypothetical protein